MTPLLTSDILSLKTGSTPGAIAPAEPATIGLPFELSLDQDLPSAEAGAEAASVPAVFTLLSGLLPLQLAGSPAPEDRLPPEGAAEETDLPAEFSAEQAVLRNGTKIAFFPLAEASAFQAGATVPGALPLALPAVGMAQEQGKTTPENASALTEPAATFAYAEAKTTSIATAPLAGAMPQHATDTTSDMTPPAPPARQTLAATPMEPSRPLSSQISLPESTNTAPDQPGTPPSGTLDTGDRAERASSLEPRKDMPERPAPAALQAPNTPQDVFAPPRRPLHAVAASTATPDEAGLSGSTPASASDAPEKPAASAPPAAASKEPLHLAAMQTAGPATFATQDQTTTRHPLSTHKSNPSDTPSDASLNAPPPSIDPVGPSSGTPDKSAGMAQPLIRASLSDPATLPPPQGDIALPETGTTAAFSTHANLSLQAQQPVTESPQSAPAIAQSVSGQIAFTVAQNPDGQTEITLSPEELGRVRLSMHSADGSISVTIHAERPETLDLMRRNIELLQRDFRALGYEQMSFNFSQQGSGQSPERPPEETGPTGMDTSGNMPEPPAPPRSLRPPATMSDRSLDLRM